MNTERMTAGAMGILCLVFASGCLQTPASNASAPKMRVGTYDSRVIIIAFAGTETFGKQQADFHAEYDKAKSAGDKKRMAELEAQAISRQKLLHKQGFSTAPVDNVLATIKDKLPEIAKTAGVQAIFSKWDKDALAKYKTAEQVDVTKALVDALNPDERARKGAFEIQKHEPIPLDQADKMSVNE